MICGPLMPFQSLSKTCNIYLPKSKSDPRVSRVGCGSGTARGLDLHPRFPGQANTDSETLVGLHFDPKLNLFTILTLVIKNSRLIGRYYASCIVLVSKHRNPQYDEDIHPPLCRFVQLKVIRKFFFKA